MDWRKFIKSNLVKTKFKEILVPKHIYKKLSEKKQKSINRFKRHQRYLVRMQKKASFYLGWERFFNSYYYSKTKSNKKLKFIYKNNKKRIHKVPGFTSGYSTIYYLKIILLKQIY